MIRGRRILYAGCAAACERAERTIGAVDPGCAASQSPTGCEIPVGERAREPRRCEVGAQSGTSARICVPIFSHFSGDSRRGTARAASEPQDSATYVTSMIVCRIGAGLCRHLVIQSRGRDSGHAASASPCIAVSSYRPRRTVARPSVPRLLGRGAPRDSAADHGTPSRCHGPPPRLHDFERRACAARLAALPAPPLYSSDRPVG
jgi:hypothetical protein